MSLTDRYFMTPMQDYRYVEFVRLDTAEHMNQAASAFLGRDASAAEFQSSAGIDLSKYPGFYVELGFCEAPVGPLTPGEVGPILTLRASRRRMSFTPSVQKVQGFLNVDRTKAWVDVVTWDALLGDDLSQKLRERQAEADSRLPPQPRVYMVDGKIINAEQLENLEVGQSIVKARGSHGGKR